MRARWICAAAVLAVVGCHSDNQISCPATLASCPATVPSAGGPCSTPSPIGGCEYGDDAWYDCDTIATCDPQSGWLVEPNLPGASCPTSIPPQCPPTFALAMSGTLSCSALPTYLTCRYPEGLCACDQGETVLTCTSPASAGCPAARPRAGTPCGADAGGCTAWGSGFCDGQSMICACGLWQPVLCND